MSSGSRSINVYMNTNLIWREEQSPGAHSQRVHSYSRMISHLLQVGARSDIQVRIGGIQSLMSEACCGIVTVCSHSWKGRRGSLLLCERASCDPAPTLLVLLQNLILPHHSSSPFLYRRCVCIPSDSCVPKASQRTERLILRPNQYFTTQHF